MEKKSLQYMEICFSDAVYRVPVRVIRREYISYLEQEKLFDPVHAVCMADIMFGKNIHVLYVWVKEELTWEMIRGEASLVRTIVPDYHDEYRIAEITFA